MKAFEIALILVALAVVVAMAMVYLVGSETEEGRRR